MTTTPVRRVVTGHDAAGRAVVALDGAPPVGLTNPAQPGLARCCRYARAVRAGRTDAWVTALTGMRRAVALARNVRTPGAAGQPAGCHPRTLATAPHRSASDSGGTA